MVDKLNKIQRLEQNNSRLKNGNAKLRLENKELKKENNLPFHLIKQSLQDLHNFKISEGEISDQLEKASKLFGGDYEAIKELIQISNKVYCDETGWQLEVKTFGFGYL